MKIVIIGGGMAGLIAGWYFKKNGNDVKIITDKKGGWQNLTSKNYKFGPRLIKVDQYAEQLLDFFGIDKSIQTIKIGYEFEDGTIQEQSDDTFKEKYALRTRETKPQSTHLSKGESTFQAYLIDYDIVLDKICDYLDNDFVIAKVNKIEKNVILLDNGEEIKGFDKMISTIPLNILTKLANLELPGFDFTAFHTSFVYCELIDKTLQSKDLDYMYSIYDNLFHRINFIKGTDKVVCEYKGKFKIEDNTSSRFKFIETTTIPFAQIKKSTQNLSKVYDIYQGIELLGRFAQWKHGIVINDILSDLNENRRWKN